MIEQFYVTNRWNPNRYYTTPGQSGPENDDNERVFHITQTPGLELHHQIQFSVILRTLNLGFFSM